MRHSLPDLLVGLKSQPPGYSFSTLEYDQYQVIFVASGRLHLVVRDQDIAAAPGHLVSLPVGAPFQLYTAAGQGYGGVFCVLRGEGLPAAFATAAAAWAGPADRAAQQLAGQMQQEIAALGTGSADLLAHLGSALAWQALRHQQAAAAAGARADTQRYWATAVRQAIQANVYTSRGVRAILENCGLSYRQLARHFKAISGEAPKEYQLRLRLREAQRLLTETNLPITSIALELGFPSSQYFATQFARLTGRTPSAVRNRRAASV